MCVLLKYDEFGGAADIGDDASSLWFGMIAVFIGGKSKLGLVAMGVCAPFRACGNEGSRGAGRLLYSAG